MVLNTLSAGRLKDWVPFKNPDFHKLINSKNRSEANNIAAENGSRDCEVILYSV